MSNVSVKSVTAVQITVSEEFAAVLKRLAYSLNWDQFPAAEEFVDELTAIDVDEADISYNEESGEFGRA